MSSKEVKAEQPKSDEPKQVQPVDRVAATFASTEKNFADLEAKAATMRRELRDQSEAYARAQEERQRAAAQWDYDEEQRRRAVRDAQKEEDRDRIRQHVERDNALQARERLFVETATELFGVSGNPFDPKQAKLSLEKKIEAAEAKGKAIAEKAAATEYATKKAIDEANAAKEIALLKAENDRLKYDNAKLEAENKRLSEVNTDLAKRQGDLASDAFRSAGGMQKQASDALQMAAQGQRPPVR